MPDIEQIRPIKERIEGQLRKIPGVHAVGIGEKYVDGKPTGENSILVLVVQKKPLDKLKSEETVPSEIDGIKTDVIQVPMPRLLMAADPSLLTATIGANQRTITFSGADKPGPGIVVMVEFTGTPTLVVPPFFAVTYRTGGDDTLADIARNVAIQIAADPSLPTAATSTGTSVTVPPPTGGTVTLTNVAISAIDDAQYFDKWVRGGIQISLADSGFGTLGCIATTAPTASDPQGKVVAITNHHVVEPDTTGETNLLATLNPVINGQILFASKDGNPIVPNTALAITITIASGTEEAIYLTVPGNGPVDVANGAAAVVTALSMAGVVATPSASTLTITGAGMRFQVRGPLQATGNFSGAVDRNTITYSGEVDNDRYGIYVDIHPGPTPSFGLFVNPPKNTNSDGMATFVLNAFQSLPAAVKGAVTMSQTGSRITVQHAEVIESRITEDIRVGQPDASFGSSCCHCCSHRIGRVLDARQDLDVALIQLDPDLKYKPEIEGPIVVAGFQAPTQTMAVFKRGRTLQGSGGLIRGLNTSGVVEGSLRLYNNTFLILSTSHDCFSAPGDSGSAVLDVSRNVVGLLWGGADVWGFATPFDRIVAAYPTLALNVAPAPAPGHDPLDVRVVPQPAAHFAALPESSERAPVMMSPSLQDRLLTAEKEVSSIPLGKEYAELIRSHFNEGQRLINENKKVATAWHRNGGPELLQAIFRIIQRADQRLPMALNGKPLADCLRDTLRVMCRYASPRLSAALELHSARLAGLAGLSYHDVLSTLQSWSEER